MACVEPVAEAAFGVDDDNPAAAADAEDDSVRDEDRECDGRSLVVEAVIDAAAVVVGIIESSRKRRKSSGESPASPTMAAPLKPETPPPLSSAKHPMDVADGDEAEVTPQPSPPQQQGPFPFEAEWPKKLVRC